MGWSVINFQLVCDSTSKMTKASNFGEKNGIDHRTCSAYTHPSGS